MQKPFGTLFGELRRRNTGMSLRKFCETHNIDASNLSKIERGKLAPPPGETLLEYIRAVNVEEFTEEWYALTNAAAVARREVPRYVKNEDVLHLMPLLFREVHDDAGNVSEERLRAILEFLRTT
jgi:transcriptional regulator with XRE-family HTH domain